jgi:IclR family mhp operon transcriptional activator
MSDTAGTEQQRSTARTLAVLRALNESPSATVSDLSLRSGVPRPSLYRILETMCAAGYLRRRDEDGRYQLTSLVRSLSSGFEEEAWISEVASPLLTLLQKEILWPTDLASYVGDAMYLRETTRRVSPLAIDHRLPGLRVPVLVSASGRAHLAYCAEAERKEILGILRKSNDPYDAAADDRRHVEHVLTETRAQGYGHRFGEFMPETGSIAVPVRIGARVIACVNITFIASVLTPAQAAARYLRAMKRTAREIETGLKAIEQQR